MAEEPMEKYRQIQNDLSPCMMSNFIKLDGHYEEDADKVLNHVLAEKANSITRLARQGECFKHQVF